MKQIRVRFAPSPTGPLHIGGVRTALYNYLFAKKNKGKFILRIEDTDRSRYVKGAEEYIFESLKWCNLLPDEGPMIGGEFGPYRQSERKEIYKQYAEKLLEKGYAYYAFDTAEELEEMRARLRRAGVPSPQYNAITRLSMKNSLSLSREETKKRLNSGEPYVIRIKIPRNEEIRFNDIIRSWIVVHSSKLDDKVLFKSDGMPTYHLANVVDDYLMKITHVIRGEEWLPSTPIHVLLYKYLGWEDSQPQFAHLPLILRPDGNGKLSKRDGDKLGFPVYPLKWKDPEKNVISKGFREEGYFPEAFINMLVLLGWNPGTNKEIFTLNELINEFSLERVGKAGARFDPEKAKWFNQQHLRRKSNKELAELVLPLLEKNNIYVEKGFLMKVCEVMKERAVFYNDIMEEGYYFFKRPKNFDKKIIRKKWNSDAPVKEKLLNELIEKIKNIHNFNEKEIEKIFKNFLEFHNLKFGDILPLFRVLITGKAQGPSIFKICEILGKEEVVERTKKSLKYLKESQNIA